jgi:hypothetical protein
MRFILLLASILVALPCFAQSPDLDQLAAIYEKLPQTEKALFDGLSQEILSESRDILDHLLEGSRPGEVDVFLKALENGEPESLVRLSTHLETHSNTYIRFLSALAERVQKRPALFKKIEDRMKSLKEILKNTKPIKPAIGVRFVNATLTAAGIIGFLYGMESAFIDPSNRREFAEGFHFVGTFLGFYLVMNIYAEIMASASAMNDYIKEWKKLRNARQLIDDLGKLVAQARQSPKFQFIAGSFKFFGSEQADRTAARMMPVISAEAVQKLEQLKASGKVDWYLNSKSFLSLIEKFKSRLSQSELEELAGLVDSFSKKYPESKTIDISPGLQIEILFLEQRIRQELKLYFSEGHGSRSDLINELARRIDFEDTRDILSTHPTQWTEISWVGLSISLGIVGLFVGVGKDVSQLDALFPEGWIQIIRDHPKTAFYSSALFAVPALANFWYNIIPKFQELVHRYLRMSISPAKLEAVLKIMAWKDWEKGIHRFNHDGAAMTAREFVERLKGNRVYPYYKLPPYCRNLIK